MASFNLRQVLGREKPHSSVTDWIEIMTGPTTAAESYEGIPELVDAINLQASGPAEATRALRKKIKHGNPHHQYRALVIMRALLENIPKKMSPAFADSQFIGILRGVWIDPNVDKRVKKRLEATLLGWQVSYRHDPDMVLYEGLHRSFKNDRGAYKREQIINHLGVPPDSNTQAATEKTKPRKKKYSKRDELVTHLGIPSEYDIQIITGEGSSELAERDKVKAEDRARRGKNQLERRKRSFNFERDKPKVLDSIVEATQASSRLINAIMLVNLEHETFESNKNVQNCLNQAKEAKKRIAYFTQLVENEDIIGTLIETHERVEAALDAYERLTTDDTDQIATDLAKTSIRDQELSSTPVDQNAAAGKAREHGDKEKTKELGDKEKGKESFDSYVHPDLADLDFGASAKNLPPPLKPTNPNTNESGQDEDTNRGSLSDFSDYESSSDDGDAYVGTSKGRNYVTVSDNSDEDQAGPSSQTQPPISQPSQPTASSNPFDDIFGDDVAVGSGR